MKDSTVAPPSNIFHKAVFSYPVIYWLQEVACILQLFSYELDLHVSVCSCLENHQRLLDVVCCNLASFSGGRSRQAWKLFDSTESIRSIRGHVAGVYLTSSLLAWKLMTIFKAVGYHFFIARLSSTGLNPYFNDHSRRSSFLFMIT